MVSGGVERLVHAMANYLVDKGHRSIVISRGGSLAKELARAGTEHLRWPYIGEKSPRSLSHILPLRQLLSRESIDVLHIHSRVPAWVGLLAWKSLPRQERPLLVSTFHGFYSINAYSAVMTKGERLIAVSNAIASHMTKEYDVAPERITTIYPGVDLEDFDPAAISSERLVAARSALLGEAGDEEPFILFPARLTWLKGHQVFLQALAEIKEMPWRAACVGEIDEASSFTAKVRGLISELGLSNRLHMKNHFNDMPAAMALADIVVSGAAGQPEAFGLTAVESQAMERPVLVTAHGGSLETVMDGETGLHVPPGDVSAMAASLTKLLTDRKLRQRLGKAGRPNILANFSMTRMCERTLALYNLHHQRF